MRLVVWCVDEAETGLLPRKLLKTTVKRWTLMTGDDDDDDTFNFFLSEEQTVDVVSLRLKVCGAIYTTDLTTAMIDEVCGKVLSRMISFC